MRICFLLILIPIISSCSLFRSSEREQSSGPEGFAPGPVTHEIELSMGRSLDKSALRNQYRDDFKHIRKRANEGVVEAKYHLGVMYLRGIGTRPNRTKAQRWLNEASVEGHRQATQVLIGMLQSAGYK